jgi:hypothetical protein
LIVRVIMQLSFVDCPKKYLSRIFGKWWILPRNLWARSS